MHSWRLPNTNSIKICVLCVIIFATLREKKSIHIPNFSSFFSEIPTETIHLNRCSNKKRIGKKRLTFCSEISRFFGGKQLLFDQDFKR